ncbi:MAG: hypothetical protein IJS33_03740 [Firmicutes bacterium]|nr:hypothetical protein [Bacillota bacterium]
MKKTQRIDAVRNIKKRLVSYLSICLVVMLGLGGFLTTIYAGEGINAKATEYYADRSFENMEMASAFGVAEEDIEKISKVEGVTEVEGVLEFDGTLEKGGERIAVELISITEKINVPELVEGALPANKNECLVGEDFAEKYNLSIGEKVRITTKDLELGNPLAINEFVITGFAHHPGYMRRKRINTVVLPLGAFNFEATNDGYTKTYVSTNTSGDVGIFDDEFFEEERAIKAELESLAQELKLDAENRFRKKAEDAIDEEWKKAEKEFSSAEKEINDNEKKLNEELDAASGELTQAERDLAYRVSEGERQLRDAETKLDRDVAAARADIAEKEAKLAEYKESIEEVDSILGPNISTMNAWVSEYEQIQASDYPEKAASTAEFIRALVIMAGTPDAKNAGAEMDSVSGTSISSDLDTLASTDVDALVQDANSYQETGDEIAGKNAIERTNVIVQATKNIVDGYNLFKANVAAAEGELENAKATLNTKETESRNEIARNRSNLYAQKQSAEAEIAAGWAEYNFNKEKYEKEIADARDKLKTEYEDAEKSVKEAKESIETPEGDWIVLDRRANSGFIDIRSNSRALNSAAYAFGVLFLLITALVCFSTIAIIIEEQKEMVGTVKAFGFFKREVLGKYLVFGVSAAIVGCILGILGSFGLGETIQRIYDDAGMYQFSQAKSIIAPMPTLIACFGIIVICILATVIACTNILRSPASVLMKGGTSGVNNAAKKTVSNKSGSLYSRLIVRNMLNDKARVFVSICIIAFSCMLIGMGFSLKFAYDGMQDKQTTEVYKYDIRMNIEGSLSEEEERAINSIIEKSGAEYIPALYESHIYRWDDKLDGLSVLAVDPDMIGDFYAITSPGTDTPIEIPSDGVLVQNRMRESYNMNVGEEFTILDSKLQSHKVSIVGEFQNYIGRDVVISSEGYEKLIGKYEPNCYFINLDGADGEALQKELLNASGEISFTPKDSVRAQFEAVALLYNVTVFITTGIAVIMSFMILTNLANIFLNRKKTELIVMRINGFSVKKTIGYLAKETVLTTIIGVALGVTCGAIFTPLLIRVMEQPDLQFIRTFHPLAWIIAVILEAAFAITVNSIVFNKVKKLNLKDIT